MVVVFWLLLSLIVVNGAPFVTTWNTSTTNEIVIFPTITPQTNVKIDWGDNTPSSSLSANEVYSSLNHTYATPGKHNVSISGEFRWGFRRFMEDAKLKLLDIVSWGDGFLVDQNSYAVDLFNGCSNMRVSASPSTHPVFLPGASLQNMFRQTAFNSSLNWDLKNVTALGYLFGSTPLNKPITFTNTQGVTTMYGMFSGASAFNQPINFDCSSVTALDHMLGGASSFNSALNLTNTNKVVSASFLLGRAVEFNQPITFRTDSMADMTAMFYGASKFNQPVNFNDMSQVTSTSQMFSGASEFNQPINFSAPNLVNVANMFGGASKFNQPVVLGTQKLTDTSHMFRDGVFNQPITFPIDYVINMRQMFQNASRFNQPINFSKSSSLKNTFWMFLNATSFNQPVIMATGNVTDMNGMFSGASSFASTVTFTSTSKVTEMDNMFDSTAAGFTQNLASWNTSLVTTCINFCSFCGLPSFPRCTPCATGTRVNTTKNTTVCPTAAPTTAVPTTKAPTAAPTAAPSTAVPTAVPTAAPTANPTAVPTSTSGPSLAPSTAMEVSAAKAADEFYSTMAVLLCSLCLSVQ